MIEIRAAGAILVPCVKIFEKFCQSSQGRVRDRRSMSFSAKNAPASNGNLR